MRVDLETVELEARLDANAAYRFWTFNGRVPGPFIRVTSEPIRDVQSIFVPPGSANIVEFKCEVPGRYVLVDHALSRAARGLAGYLVIEGEENKDIFDAPPNENAAGGHRRNRA